MITFARAKYRNDLILADLNLAVALSIRQTTKLSGYTVGNNSTTVPWVLNSVAGHASDGKEIIKFIDDGCVDLTTPLGHEMLRNSIDVSV